MQHLLLHPPLADPTQPFLSLPTLKGWLRAHGHDARVIDLNIEAAHWLFEPTVLDDLGRRIGSRFVDLNRQQELSFHEQRQYRLLVEARPKIEHAIGGEISPITVFQTRELFYDPAQYSLARRKVEGLFEALSAAHYPYRFSFNHAAHAVVPWSLDLLDRYCSERRSPFAAFYERHFATADEWDWSNGSGPPADPSDAAFIGISVVFPSQIPEALYLCRFLRQRAPTAFLALGGPCIHQVVVHMEPALQARMLAYVDGIALFESEETLTELFSRLEQWRNTADAAARHEILRDVPNLLTMRPAPEPVRTAHVGGSVRSQPPAYTIPGESSQAASAAVESWTREAGSVPIRAAAATPPGTPVVGPRRTLDLREAPAPDYSDLDLDRYWAPSRTLLYAPTRGCYWNQCSFCYYGLAETATANYREVPAARAAADLAQLARRHGVKNFYISCDVLSPAYAVKLAEALIERNVKIRWSSDLKIEKYFTPERCALLHRAGLRSAAFGIESGSDRILELMRKGCDRATMTAVNRAFHDAGVATEWMTFTDHPDETLDEALDTVRWIEEEKDFVDLFIVGRFGLERGSDIAQDPTRYGVRKVFYAEGDELRLYAQFTQRAGRRGADAEQTIENAISRAGSSFDLHPYPWAGANSTHHTFLHFLEFGQTAFKQHFKRAGGAVHGAMPTSPVVHIAGLRERPRYSLQTIRAREEKFFADYLPRALYTTVPSRRHGGEPGDEVSPLSVADFEAAVAAVEAMR
jgi:radical SAM superfamily enzyme YgiQ (UPF0313 family)